MKVFKKCSMSVLVAFMLLVLASTIGCSGSGIRDDDDTETETLPLLKAARLTQISTSTDEVLKEAIKKNLADFVRFNNVCRIDDYDYGDVVFSGSSSPSAPVATAESSTGAEPQVQFTNTNVQERGVDEADIVKSDGTRVFVLSQGKLRIFKVWPMSEFAALSETEIEGVADSMYLIENKVVALTSVRNKTIDGQRFSGIKVTTLDVDDPASPEVVKEAYYEGSLISSRAVSGKIHLILNNNFRLAGVSYYAYDIYKFCSSNRQDLIDKGVEEVIEKNNSFIEKAAVKTLLPVMANGQKTMNYRPQLTLLGSKLNQGVNLISLISFDVDEDVADSVVSVEGSGSTIYATTESIYVTQPVNSWDFIDLEKEGIDVADVTLVHRFDISLGRKQPAYFGTGAVSGHIIREENGQFALSEYEGHLRMAATVGEVSRSGSLSENNVYVMDIDDTNLKIVGKITGLAKGEKIYSVRFMGHRGFIVTFKKVDPLFAIDLADPTDPKVMAELKIPGFSTYLHPYDEDHLLGLGKDAQDMEDFAWFQGVKLSLFDVSDMSAPTELYNTIIGGRGTESEALYNHHAFTFSKEDNLLAIPIILFDKGSGNSNYGSFKYSGLQIYDVSPEGGINLKGELAFDTSSSNYYNYYGRKALRSIIFSDGQGEGVVTILNDGISLNFIDDEMTEAGSEEWDIVEDDFGQYVM